ncbi:LOW QUALITY PROTEIN: ovarian-specific serine/threonine-protein kinase Lok-like [Ctenocephalides felis]|uniref:LOW QUALITY PROTEIN: ovarian-specific serine/threonine-protein kinase Lok-like n=1 Tax=Ctenocephalides felis TaxID=7515 RepID=UPI000E6E3D36|nr:LOW QUALITY PROTEIN: ovarian-specific serine/threonine-protein kinase Lok-like [Ctenocephalides felis]
MVKKLQRKPKILQNEDIFDRFTHTVDKIPKLIKDDYYISRELGSGACGVVRLIFNKRTCDKFAMKAIIKSKADDEKKLNHPNRIMNEINIMKKLDHPFIVSVYNIVETPEAVFLILELMNGGDLYNKIKESKYLKEPIVKNIIYQLAVAVNYLHRQNITHRDLKPENILLQSNSDDSIVKLSDFGLSKIVEGNTVLQTECGTAWYVAPEVILKNYKTYTEKVDVWSLGVIYMFVFVDAYPSQQLIKFAKENILSNKVFGLRLVLNARI